MILVTGIISNLRKGGPVKYRGLTVGEITGVRLADSQDRVLVGIHIHSDYRPLVSSSTKFWTPAGFEFNFSLFGESRFRAPSLSAVFSGFVAFFTPQGEQGEPVEPGRQFRLYDKPEPSWIEQQQLPEDSGKSSAAPD